MRKVSAHGLGHLIAPYRAEEAPPQVPAPHPSVLTKGTERWHSDLWRQIVSAAVSGRPDSVDLDFHPALNAPAMSRYGATTPDLLRWFKQYNRKRAYRQQVKPFGFLYSLQAALPIDEEVIATKSNRRQRSSKPSKPIALFDRDLEKAVETAFDRDTGRTVPPHRLKSFADALSSYHLHPESKFLNGDYLDRGTTRRRHVCVATVQHIGKEANDWERQAVLGIRADAQPTYGVGSANPEFIANELQPMIARWGASRCARAFSISAATLRSLMTSPAGASGRTCQQVAARMHIAKRLFERLEENRRTEIDELRQAVRLNGLRPTARLLGRDASNLRRTLRLAC